MWFDDDAGQRRSPRPRHPLTGRNQPTLTIPYFPDPLPTSFGVARRARPWRPSAEPTDVLLGLPDSPLLAWDAPPSSLRRAARTRAGEAPGRLPDAGPDTQGLPWMAPMHGLRRQGPWRPLESSPLVPEADDGIPSLGWRAHETAPRWRRPSFRTQPLPGLVPAEDVPVLFFGRNDEAGACGRRSSRFVPHHSPEAVPPGWLADVAAWLAALQPQEGRGSRRPAPVALQHGLPPLAVQIDAPAWFAALQANEPLRRLARPVPRWSADTAAAIWWGVEITTGAGWGPWLDKPAALLRGRRPVIAHAPGWVLDVQYAAFWLPVDDGSRAQPNRRPWQPFRPEYAAPPWLGAGQIVVAGPFYCVVGAVYVAGAVEGFAESTS